MSREKVEGSGISPAETTESPVLADRYKDRVRKLLQQIKDAKKRPLKKPRDSRIEFLGIQPPLPGFDQQTPLYSRANFIGSRMTMMGKDHQTIGLQDNPLADPERRARLATSEVFGRLAHTLFEIYHFTRLANTRLSNGGRLGVPTMEDYFPTCGRDYVDWVKDLNNDLGNNKVPRFSHKEKQLFLSNQLRWGSVDPKTIELGQES